MLHDKNIQSIKQKPDEELLTKHREIKSKFQDLIIKDVDRRDESKV